METSGDKFPVSIYSPMVFLDIIQNLFCSSFPNILFLTMGMLSFMNIRSQYLSFWKKVALWKNFISPKKHYAWMVLSLCLLHYKSFTSFKWFQIENQHGLTSKGGLTCDNFSPIRYVLSIQHSVPDNPRQPLIKDDFKIKTLKITISFLQRNRYQAKTSI